MTDTPMPPALLVLAEKLQETARRVALQQQVKAMAFIADSSTGQVIHAIEMGLESDTERALTVRQIRGLLSGLGGDAVITVTESWAYFGPDCQEKRALYGSVEKIPGALELVFIHVETATGRWQSSNEVERDKRGRRRDLHTHTFAACDSGGALTGFF